MDIQLFKPKYEVEECLEEIRDCLEKGWTGLGYKTVAFENAWKDYTQLPFAYYMNSATMALNLGVLILKEKYGWKDGDEIITTPITFVSTNHAIIKAGLKAEFADIDETMCLSPASVKKHIHKNTKAVMFVGMGGNTGKFPEIVEICKKNNLKLILDGAHMAGTRLNGEIPGKECDAVIYSYQAVKNLPTGDSGMLCFNDGELDSIARKMGWLGINKDTYERSNDSGNYKWRYDVEYTGEKAHGNSIMAAIGLVQLKYLDRDNAYRRQVAEWYRNGFRGHEDYIQLIPIGNGCESSTHLFQILVEERDRVMVELNANHIAPGVHYVDNTTYRMYDYAKGTCPFASYSSERVISLPMHMGITYKDVEYIVEQVIKAAKRPLCNYVPESEKNTTEEKTSESRKKK